MTQKLTLITALLRPRRSDSRNSGGFMPPSYIELPRTPDVGAKYIVTTELSDGQESVFALSLQVNHGQGGMSVSEFYGFHATHDIDRPERRLRVLCLYKKGLPEDSPSLARKCPQPLGCEHPNRRTLWQFFESNALTFLPCAKYLGRLECWYSYPYALRQ